MMVTTRSKQLITVMHQVKLIYFDKLNNKVLVNQHLPLDYDLNDVIGT